MKNGKLTGLEALEAHFWGRGDRDCSMVFPPDEDGVQVSSNLDARGRELPDPVPMAPPVGYRDGPSLADFVQRMIRQEVSKIAEDNSFETFEEADDFDTGEDDVDPLTPYEQVFDPAFRKPAPAPQLAEDAEKQPGGAGGSPPAKAPSAAAEAAPARTLT